MKNSVFTITVEIDERLSDADLKELRQKCLTEVREICQHQKLISCTVKSDLE